MKSTQFSPPTNGRTTLLKANTPTQNKKSRNQEKRNGDQKRHRARIVVTVSSHTPHPNVHLSDKRRCFELVSELARLFCWASQSGVGRIFVLVLQQRGKHNNTPQRACFVRAPSDSLCRALLDGVARGGGHVLASRVISNCWCRDATFDGTLTSAGFIRENSRHAQSPTAGVNDGLANHASVTCAMCAKEPTRIMHASTKLSRNYVSLMGVVLVFWKQDL